MGANKNTNLTKDFKYKTTPIEQLKEIRTTIVILVEELFHGMQKLQMINFHVYVDFLKFVYIDKIYNFRLKKLF